MSLVLARLRALPPTTVSLIVMAVLMVVILVLPSLLSLHWLRVMTGILMMAVVAQGINIMAGFVGYPAFGNVVFFGLGAYGVGIAASSGMSLATGLLFGIGASTLLALCIGSLLLRLRGHYFAIATLGLNEAVSAISANLTSVTGGGTGLSLPLAAGTAADLAYGMYYRFAALFVASLLVALFLRTSRFGYACRAIRANEDAAAAAGVNALVVKLMAWIASAVLTTIAGGLYARWVGFIEPAVVFDMGIAVKAFVMFLLGGAGTIFGPVIGAFAIEGVTTMAWSYVLKGHLLVLGVLIMVVVLALPNGIQAFAATRWRWVERHLLQGGVK
jgi:branched-chain amino acid transport system permease protein